MERGKERLARIQEARKLEEKGGATRPSQESTRRSKRCSRTPLQVAYVTSKATNISFGPCCIPRGPLDSDVSLAWDVWCMMGIELERRGEH